MFGLLKRRATMSAKVTVKTWQSKRIDAINRKIQRCLNKRAATEAYMCEYDRVYNSKFKTKKEYKLWIRENGKA